MAATGKTPILLYGSTTATNVPVAGNLTNSSDGCELAINVADKNLFFKDSTNAVNTVPIRQSSASSNGWLSSTDWTTFNGKQASLVSGTNIKTVGGNTLLGSGDAGTINVNYGGTGLTSVTAGYIPFGNSATALSSDSKLFWDNTNKRLGIGTNSPSQAVSVYGGGYTLNLMATAAPDIAVRYTFGSNEWTIGSNTGFATAGNYLAINQYTGGAWNNRMYFGATGGVSIGNTTDPGAGNFTINGATATKASGTTWANPSDIRLKNNIRPFTKSINELVQINPCVWEYNGKGGTVSGTKGLGVIADEIEKILPETVDTYVSKLNKNDLEETEIKRFDATEITWILVNAVKDLNEIVKLQSEQIKWLQGAIK